MKTDRIYLADAEQQNAKAQGRKEIPFDSRAWAAFGRIPGRAAGESAILLVAAARAFSGGSPKDAPARSAAPMPVAQCRSLRLAFAFCFFIHLIWLNNCNGSVLCAAPLRCQPIPAQAMKRAIPNAAAAANPPINVVCSALRNGRVPVKCPFT